MHVGNQQGGWLLKRKDGKKSKHARQVKVAHFSSGLDATSGPMDLCQ